MNSRKELKILLPALHYPPVIGGFEIFTKNIAERLAKKNKVYIITGKVDGMPNKEKHGNLTVIRTGIVSLKNLSHSSAWYIFSTLIAIIYKSISLSLRKKVDILHCQGFFSGIVGIKLKWLLKIPYIITIQSADYEVYHPKFSQGWMIKFKLYLEKIVFRGASARHAVSNALVEYYVSFGLKDAIMVPNGVELSLFQPAQDKIVLRNELGFRTQNLLICVSRLEHKNGTHDLIKAAVLIKKEISDFKILIVGGGSEETELKKLSRDLYLEKEVIFLGDVLHSDLPKYLSASDIFIRPALAEGFGIVFLEAMASGVAVIGTPVGGIVDFIIEGQTGLFCQPASSVDISKQVIKLLRDKALSEKIIVGGLKLVEEKYNWDNVAESIEKILSSVARKKRVLIVSGIFPPDIGGPATYLVNLANDLSNGGCEIGVLTFGEKEVANKYSFSVWKVSKSFSKIFRFFIILWQAFSKSDNFNIIYLHDVYSSGLAGFLAGKLRWKKIVTRFVGDSAWEYAISHNLTSDDLLTFQDKKLGLRIDIKKFIRGVMLRRSDAIVVPSDYLRRVALKIGVSDSKINIIYNSVDFLDSEIAKLGSKEESKNKLELSGQIILSAARLAPWKGMDILIESYSQIAGKYPDSRLVILGEGSEMEKLKLLVRQLKIDDQVILAGKVSRDKMLEYLNSADIFALNTNYEGMSHTILEAMKLELPIITTNAGGNPETVQNGQAGILVNYNDKKAFKEAFDKLLADSSLIKKMGDLAKEESKKYKWANVVDKTIEAFDNL